MSADRASARAEAARKGAAGNGSTRSTSTRGASGRGASDRGASTRGASTRNAAGRPPGRAPRREPRRAGLDTPLDSRRARRAPAVDAERFGRWSERFARFMGTAWFLVGMTVFVCGWLAWNAFAPASVQFDPRRLNFTLLTLILSLQASYAAPLILLAQNRQADRDRVTAEQDRDRAERALADTEYLAREVAALRIALGDVVTRDFLRSELRALIDETSADRGSDDPLGSTPPPRVPTVGG